MKSFLGIFYGHLAIFLWSHWPSPQLITNRSPACSLMTVTGSNQTKGRKIRPTYSNETVSKTGILCKHQHTCLLYTIYCKLYTVYSLVNMIFRIVLYCLTINICIQYTKYISIQKAVFYASISIQKAWPTPVCDLIKALPTIVFFDSRGHTLYNVCQS